MAGSYVRSAWPMIALAAGAALMCALIVLASGLSVALALLIAGIIMTAAVVALVVDYRCKRPFFEDLAACTDEIEHPLWIAELIDEPKDVGGALAYRAIRAVAKAANDDVAAYRRQVADYREYVETWVHEAKSPLAAARLMLDNLEDSASAGADAMILLDKAAALGEELDRVEGYIEQALFFARSESLDRDYLIRPCVLTDLVGAAIKARARVLIGAHMAPQCRNLDFTVFTDEKWMLFILGQLIQNSVQYARVEGAELVFEGRLVDEGLAAERVELTVRDNGCGVAPADLPRVFDRGFTGENGRSGKRSTGIGLYLVKRLCDKMGLGVSAASDPGDFFAVTISFPTNKMHYFE